MAIIHKRTHRPLAIVALLALFGMIGWQLPSLGDAVLAYSSRAVTAARAAIASAGQEKTAPAGDAAARLDRAATQKKAVPAAKAADTPAQTALNNARTALNSAIDANRATPTKANAQVVEARLADFNTAAAVRVAEIKAILNATVNGVPANYDDLVAEMKSLGGIGILAPAPGVTAEVEPNDTPAAAQTLNLSLQNVTIVSGAVTPSGDDDVFKFSAPANSRVSVLVDTGGTLVSGFRDSIVAVLGTNGTTVLEEDDDDGVGNGGDGTQESGLASTIAGLPLTAAGDYYIRVRSWDDTEIVNPYKLFVIVTTVTPTAEVEANNDAASANAIVTTASTVGVRSGSIGTAGDVDFYSVQATAGNVLFISADGNPERDASNSDLVVQLRDTNGTTVLFSADSNFGGTATNPSSESFNYTIPATGTYYVSVRLFSSSATGTYNLTVAAANSDPVGGTQVCPPLPITSSLGVAGGNFTKVSGTLTQRLNRDGVVSACGVARTQNAPIAATRTYDKYTLTNSAGGTRCITVQLKVLEQTASNYQVGAFSVLNPTNLTSGWLGDSGASTGIPPTVQTFSVNIAAGATFDVVVFNANATGDGNAYELSVFGFDTCAVPACVLTKPADITVANAAGQCGATVTFANPGTGGFCQTVTCVPASGSFFPKGTTTVTCTGTSPGNPNATTSFNVTVNDAEAPTIACSSNVFAGTTGTSTVVNYALPTVGDNCPGVQAPVCVPAPGSSFPLGVTTVNCSVKDAVNNSSSCSFQVTVNKETPLTLNDPLSCTGPGNVLRGAFSLSNNGNVSQTVTATAAMPVAAGRPLLLALPGSCTASTGTCTVVNATTITWTGTLAAGASATINYEVQVNDGVPQGTPMTIVTTASWNGGPALVVNTTTNVTCAPVGVGTPYQAASPISDQKAGSLLIYPVYTSSVGQNNQNSQISITNTHPTLNAYVHLYFVADNCAVSDAFLCLTPNQTSSFLASDLDPGTTGYLVAMAVNGVSGCPINFNYLIGDEYVKFASGHAANLGAEAVSAIAGSANWASAFCNQSTFATSVRFDGVTYGQLPTTVAVDHLGSRADGNDTMLILNGLGGDLRTSPATLGSIFGVLYDDSEAAFSFSITSASCQFRTSINNNNPRTTPRFEQVIPAGRTGWMRMWHRFGGPVIGAVINFNPNASASSSAFSQGHNLHKLTLAESVTLTVPVFPPTC